MLLIPGVVETTSNFVEHPEVVARRIEEAVAAVGERERVIASTDCGFGTFTNREWVIEPAVWLKLRCDPRRAPISPRPGCGEQEARRDFPLCPGQTSHCFPSAVITYNGDIPPAMKPACQ